MRRSRFRSLIRAAFAPVGAGVNGWRPHWPSCSVHAGAFIAVLALALMPFVAFHALNRDGVKVIASGVTLGFAAGIVVLVGWRSGLSWTSRLDPLLDLRSEEHTSEL